jgi:hypothetical protein
MTKTRWLGLASLLAICLAVYVVGSSRVVKVYTCHISEARKRVETRTFMFVPLAPVVTIKDASGPSTGGVYDWWLYSTVREFGPGGLLGLDVQTERFQYRDGSRATRLADR